MIHIKLDKQIDGNKLLEKIQSLIHKCNVDSNSILEIRIKNISYDDITAIPKLEYKQC